MLDPHAKFLAGYPPLVATRANAINEQESVLTFQLDPQESVAADVKVASSFQAFVKDSRDARERAVVGSMGVDPAVAASHPSLGKTFHAVIQNKAGLLTFYPDRLQFDSPDVSVVSVVTHSGGHNSRSNSYIAEIDLARNSPFFQQNKSLVRSQTKTTGSS